MKEIDVLVVDDDEITLELVALVLEEYTSGTVDSFSNSSEAIDVLQKADGRQYSLVVSDLVMPEKNGLDVLVAARKAIPNVPFLMLTANATRDIVLKARKLGASGFMAKPFATNDLLDKIDTIVD